MVVLLQKLCALVKACLHARSYSSSSAGRYRIDVGEEGPEEACMGKIGVVNLWMPLGFANCKKPCAAVVALLFRMYIFSNHTLS
jgi:hypothetical protein